MPIEKCVGAIVELIYEDSKGNITKRTIRVREVDRKLVRGFDTAKKAYRTFALDRILASLPVGRV